MLGMFLIYGLIIAKEIEVVNRNYYYFINFSIFLRLEVFGPVDQSCLLLEEKGHAKRDG